MSNNNIPYGKILSPKQIGEAIRARRKELDVTQVKTAGFSKVGLRFLSELERGKETAELGKTLTVLRRLGLDVFIAPRGNNRKAAETENG